MLALWKQDGPPVYLSVAAYLGLGKTTDTKGSKTAPVSNAGIGDDPAQLLAQFPGGMIN